MIKATGHRIRVVVVLVAETQFVIHPTDIIMEIRGVGVCSTPAHSTEMHFSNY